MKWLQRLIAWLLSLFDQPSPIPEPFKVPEIPIDSGLPAVIPGVQQVLPPVEYFGALSAAIEKFASVTLRPEDRGGLIAIATMRPDGTKAANAAIVQRVGKKALIVGWVGKSWGTPAAKGWETGIAWQQRW